MKLHLDFQSSLVLEPAVAVFKGEGSIMRICPAMKRGAAKSLLRHCVMRHSPTRSVAQVQCPLGYDFPDLETFVREMSARLD
jgi:hypothetical protein